MSLKLAVLVLALISVTLADPERPGRYLEHNNTVINCARYKREANQHSCVLAPKMTEGPYFLPDDWERSDITDGQAGIPFDLTIRIVNSNDCNPLSGMYVHLWHANAVGSYSGVGGLGAPPGGNRGNGGQKGQQGGFGGPGGQQGGFGGPGGQQGGFGGPGGQQGGFGGHGSMQGQQAQLAIQGRARPTPVNNERYLRGYQVTNEAGEVNFKTIIPGWYSSRALHMHMEVFSKNSTERADTTYTGQIFFREDLPSELQLIEPYSQTTMRLTLNSQDGIYLGGGAQTTAELVTVGSGFLSVMTFGVNPTA